MPKTGENIYKRKDGRWEARFISGRKPDGCAKYTSVYARTYAAAKAKLEERKRMVVSRPAGSCRLTVKELFVWYLSQAEIKPSTRARYVFLIEHHMRPAVLKMGLTLKASVRCWATRTLRRRCGCMCIHQWTASVRPFRKSASSAVSLKSLFAVKISVTQNAERPMISGSIWRFIVNLQKFTKSFLCSL